MIDMAMEQRVAILETMINMNMATQKETSARVDEHSKRINDMTGTMSVMNERQMTMKEDMNIGFADVKNDNLQIREDIASLRQVLETQRNNHVQDQQAKEILGQQREDKNKEKKNAWAMIGTVIGIITGSSAGLLLLLKLLKVIP